jgi:hypothetical protein
VEANCEHKSLKVNGSEIIIALSNIKHWFRDIVRDVTALRRVREFQPFFLRYMQYDRKIVRTLSDLAFIFIYSGKNLALWECIQDSLARLARGKLSARERERSTTQTGTKDQIQTKQIFPAVLYGCESWSLTSRRTQTGYLRRGC